MSSSSQPEVPDSPAGTTSKEDLIRLRKKYFSKALSVSHAKVAPLVVMRGEKEFLFDESFNVYLDTRNNVPILGHSDKRVVDAVYSQMNLINTNTRYLHPSQVELASQLSSILPDRLCKFFFVNSGSEANDLALRLARYHTGSRRVIALSQAYHGCTTACVEVSECKFSDPCCVKEEWVDIVDCPNLVSGPYTWVQPYIDQVSKICDQHPKDISAIILESVISVGGGIFHPQSYVSSVFANVRAAGGVCICDETQVGLGRTGLWWAFQMDPNPDAVPDILTIGKQLGNGFPVAAVITTSDIAKSLERTGIEFFSTYGGSTVSCAAAIATLKALKEDNAVSRARETGRFLLERLGIELGIYIPNFIRDIRGRGLYLALELRDGDLASHVVNSLYRDYRILSTLDGPDEKVIIVKPPLCISRDSCERFVQAIKEILANA